MLRTLFLLTAVLHFYYTLYYDWLYIRLPEQYDVNSWFRPSKFKFLTFWNVVLQAIFFTVCVLAHLFARNRKEHVLRRLQNRMMVSLAYPLAWFVGITFWGIYCIDRELILPRALDKFFPTWLNHCMHSNIMLFMLLEFLTFPYTYAPRAQNLKILFSLMIAYLMWLLVIFAITGVWVYPILTVLSWPEKIVFFAACLGVALGLYFTGELLNRATSHEMRTVEKQK